MSDEEDRWVRRRGERVFGRSSGYRVCTRCIMDTSDPEIEFDEAGVCNHCHDYERRVAAEVFPGVKGKQQLAKVVAQIKREGRGKKYDCILGLSGGVDSTYVAYVTKQLGLRPLAVHMDNGWNSEISVRNIENIVNILGIDLYTEVLDWEEFRRLQVAFLRASTPDSEIPTDHAIIATLYRQAAKHGIRWIMDGSNVVTEIMVPATWSHGHSDWGYIKHLNDTFGGAELKTYPHYDYYDLLVRFPHRQRIQRFPLLNYIDFNKLEAIEVMKRELNWTPYGGKHYESIYTRFYQGYILPKKFGFDKRRSHLSCLVNNGRMTREEALREIQQPALPEEMEREDRVFVAKKLGLSEAEFDEIMNAPRKTFWDYPSSERDLPGTKLYRNYYWQAQFFSGKLWGSEANQIGYYTKYYIDRYLYYTKWWINRIAYYTWWYIKRYAYYTNYYINRFFYYTWYYIKRYAYYANYYVRRLLYYTWYYIKRSAYYANYYIRRFFYYLSYYVKRTGYHLGVSIRRALYLALRMARASLNLAARARRYGVRLLTTASRYAWRAVTRPDRVAARIAGLLGIAR